MVTKDLIAKVEQLYAAFGRGDIASILNTVAPNVVWEADGPPHLPFYGPRRGRGQVAQFFQAVSSQLDFETFTPQEFIAQGDKVVVLGFERGRARATGRSVEGHWAHVFTFEGGKVVAFREYGDTAAMAAAFQGRVRAAA